jgi:hypothetical protein
MKVTVSCILPENGPCEFPDLGTAISSMIARDGLLPRQGDSISVNPNGTSVRMQQSGEQRKCMIGASMEVDHVIIFPEDDAVSITLIYPEGEEYVLSPK